MIDIDEIYNIKIWPEVIQCFTYKLKKTIDIELTKLTHNNMYKIIGDLAATNSPTLNNFIGYLKNHNLWTQEFEMFLKLNK